MKYSSLLQPYKLSPELILKNKIIMAPMTRRAADNEGCPIESMADYYARRAECGLIISEGTLISEDAIGHGNIPGIYSQKQIDSWKIVTSKVHKEGGLIFMQLWHCGRMSHPKFHHGQLPISASSTFFDAPLGTSGYRSGHCREATEKEITDLIQTYAKAAKNAVDAGFDGIEIHGANGYLVDQFLHGCTNLRNDKWGGSPEKRTHFCMEIVQACIKEIGKERVGLRLSPGGHMAGIINDAEDKIVFSHLLQTLSEHNIAYVHMGNFDDTILYPELENKTMTEFSRSYYLGTLIASGGYSIANAEEGVREKRFDLVAIGRPFIANPDLIHKIKSDLPIRDYDPTLLGELY